MDLNWDKMIISINKAYFSHLAAYISAARLEDLQYMYLSKKGYELVAILCDYFVKTKSQTHRDSIIANFTNSVNTYAHTYNHRSCAHFVNFANVSMRIA